MDEIKTEILLQNEDPSHHQIPRQKHMERIESLSPESKKSRFCVEVGFMRVVEVEQYFMTRTLAILDNFVQCLVVSTFFHETTELLNQKDGFKET